MRTNIQIFFKRKRINFIFCAEDEINSFSPYFQGKEELI